MAEAKHGVLNGLSFAPTGEGRAADWRFIENGAEMPRQSYSDQPYVVKTSDGAWLATVTTGPGEEGAGGQHVISMRSEDMGKTWSAPVDVEPALGPEASYAVLLATPYGRVYCLYNHNTDNVREVKANVSPWSPHASFKRVDSLGHYVFKYTDDGGRSWSSERYDVPVREFATDRENPYGGKLRFFWNVGRPFVRGGVAYLSLHKVGRMGHGFFERSEGVLIASDNMLTERDPRKLRFETLPDGDVGLITPPGGGEVAEEQSYSLLSDGSIFVVYRTVDGHPVISYSRDGGHTFQPPRYMAYADGRPVKHPRAANFCWKLENGKFLYWYHNNGGQWYEDRNPVWVLGGEEADGENGREIRFTQPEILLYDLDPFVRMSYPDLIEDGGRCFVTETQKNAARIHEIPADFLTLLFSQFTCKEKAGRALLARQADKDGLRALSMPRLPDLRVRNNHDPAYRGKDTCAGLTIEAWLDASKAAGDGKIIDARTEGGVGFALWWLADGRVRIVMNDEQTENIWTSTPDLLNPAGVNHVGVVIDGGPSVVSFVINGRFEDGGKTRVFGWGRFSPLLRHVSGAQQAVCGTNGVIVRELSLYGAALTTTELIASFRSGC